jgi:hypothetical protein
LKLFELNRRRGFILHGVGRNRWFKLF